MKEIRGDAKNIRILLGGARYAIDYYQREYRWESKQIDELIEDLEEKFFESHDDNNERSDVEYYGHYFLGSIIISNKDGRKYIIDGQQRLTSLTLLLIFIHRTINDNEQKGQLAELIFSMKLGKRSFNLDVPERTACMEALYMAKPYDDDDQPESIEKILGRFQDIEDNFPDSLAGKTLPFFADWLIENVYLVEITAYSDSDAYTIFETMNDRGLSLTPTDMLKGYLLANITDQDSRMKSSKIWRDHITKLQGIGKEEDADAIKAWLRGQHAQTIRERKKGAKPMDFDLIGTEFHRWIRDQASMLNLKSSSDFSKIIQTDFAFYANWYKRLRDASKEKIPSMEAIFYNAQSNFTLQYPVLLSALNCEDSETEHLRKISIISNYIDIVIARRVWNWKSTDHSAMQYNMFLAIKEIRGKSSSELSNHLVNRIEDEPSFYNNDRFSLHGGNGRKIHRLLARITDFIETASGRNSRYEEYISRKGKNGYEIEHIWADHFDRHTDEFDHSSDFSEYRNRIGGLLLLPKSFNASYGDMPFKEKREQYIKQNLLAQSLHERAYQNDPGFRQFIEKSGLDFKPQLKIEEGDSSSATVDNGLEIFKKADLDARQVLYCKIANQVWNPRNIMH